MDRKGYFANNGTSYVVKDVYSQIPYTNVLYNMDGYMTDVTQWGENIASARFDDQEVCTITLEGYNAFYIRNEKNGKVWCPCIEPMHSDVQDFCCEHGDGYSTISSRFDGILTRIKTFVPDRGYRQFWTVEITNETTEEATLSIVPMIRAIMFGFSAPRFCNSVGQSFVTTFEQNLNGLYFNCGNPNTKGKPYDAVFAASKKVDFYSGDLRKILAGPLNLSYPYCLMKGKNLDCSTAMNDAPIFALQNVVSLPIGETARIDYLFGNCCNRDEALEMVAVLQKNEVDIEFADTIKKISERRNRVVVKTPDEKINYFVNTWLKKGMEYCLLKKNAVRDNLQFAFGLTMTEPEVTKNTLRTAFRYQYQDGHTVRSWKPLDTTYYSDGQLWCVLVACDYLKYTGDFAFLSEVVPYHDGGEGTVLEHLEKGIGRLQEDKGPHGICLARWADWNDALNLSDPEAESVFVSMGLAWCMLEMAEMLEYIGENEKAKAYRNNYEALKTVINDTCWDHQGEYYVRGFSDKKVIGGSESEGAFIYANPQTWAILSGVATPERLKKIVNATEKYIVTDLGCLVNYPAYENYIPMLGRISYQVPGTTENGAVYCHATAFKINADIKRGNGEHAYRDLKKILPDSVQNPIDNSGALPYTLTSCYATNPHIWGRSGRPWLTGSQGWVMRCVVEGLLGIQKAYGGFVIDPALPTDWKSASAVIIRENTEYYIQIHRTGDASIIVDGMPMCGKFVAFSDKKRVLIDVTV